MRHFGTLLLKEEKAIFSSPIAYATVAVYLLLMGYTFTAVLFLNRTGELVRVFFQAAVLFLLIVPVVTMRLFAEERRAGTLELLLTSPVREIEIVLAKFVAGLSLPSLMLALTGSYADRPRRLRRPRLGPDLQRLPRPPAPGRRAHRHRAPGVRAHREPDRGGRRRAWASASCSG